MSLFRIKIFFKKILNKQQKKRDGRKKKILETHWSFDYNITCTIKKNIDKTNPTTSRKIINGDPSKPHLSFEAIVTRRCKVVHLSLETNVTHSGHLWWSFLVWLNLSRWDFSDSIDGVVIKASVSLPPHLIFLKETVILNSNKL